MIYNRKFISGEEVKKNLGIVTADLKYLILEGLLVAHTENFEPFTKEGFHEMVSGPYAYLTSDWPEAGYDGFYFDIDEVKKIEVEANEIKIKDFNTQSLETGLNQHQWGGEYVFARNGEIWFTRFSGVEKQFKDRRGFHFIANLLNSPNTDIECLDLSQVKALPVTSSHIFLKGDGAALSQGLKITDGRPHSEYDEHKKKIENEFYELNLELENAEKHYDIPRIERCKRDIENFKDSIRPSYEPDNPREKARANVTSQIKESIRCIEREHLPLGKHLDSYIKTGNSCSYRPSPDSAIVWNVQF